MRNNIALFIAKTGMQEIRVLLRQGKSTQALEMADSLNNLPMNQANSAQALHTTEAIAQYLSRYPCRRELSHWRDLLMATDIKADAGKPVIYRRSTQATNECPV